MSSYSKVFATCLILLTGVGIAADVDQVMKVDRVANQWIVHSGRPLYYATEGTHYSISNQATQAMNYYLPDAVMSLSPTAEYSLLSQLEPMEQVRDNKRYSNFLVLDQDGEMVYKITKGNGVDLKPHVAAVSDQGVLALVDPISAKIFLYQAGELLIETQLYATEGDYSLERKVRVQWADNRCHVLIERPSPNGGSPENVLFISIDAEGKNQHTAIMPFTYLQKILFSQDGLFMSGYSYDPKLSEMQPLIIQTAPNGEILWTNEHFGHELALSEDGSYLAARSGHDLIYVFDLGEQRIQEIKFAREGKAALGLSVNSDGEVALIRVSNDFFVKRDSHYAEVFFPQSMQTVDVQLNPNSPGMFQLYSTDNNFFLGTKHEWLEISK